MYQSFEIKNFRCFDEFRMTDIERVNLIAGKNNVGKTALLEALYIHAKRDKANVVSEINANRGTEYSLDTAPGGVVWAPLFRQLDTALTIGLSATSTDGEDSVTTLREPRDANELSGLPDRFRRELEDVIAKLHHSDGAPQDIMLLELAHEARGERVADYIAAPSTGLIPRFARAVRYGAVFVSAMRRGPSRENGDRFRAFAVEKRTQELVDMLHAIDTRVQDLELLPFGDELVIHGDVGLAKLLPISVLGDGIVRLVSLILAMTDTQGEVLLIDEIENGFHYTVLKDVWRVIGQAARRFDTQVFATTHSLECVRAAHEAFAEGEQYDFRLHRLQRLQGRIGDVVYDQETLETALEIGMEVR